MHQKGQGGREKYQYANPTVAKTGMELLGLVGNRTRIGMDDYGEVNHASASIHVHVHAHCHLYISSVY